MKIQLYDYETEETKIITLQEFEYLFNYDEINQSNCKITFIKG